MQYVIILLVVDRLVRMRKCWKLIIVGFKREETEQRRKERRKTERQRLNKGSQNSVLSSIVHHSDYAPPIFNFPL